MKKWIVAVVGILLALGIFISSRMQRQKDFDRTVSYSMRSFRPYDTRFFFLTLKNHTNLRRSAHPPGGKKFSGTGKTYVVCSPYFLPDRKEKRDILRFVERGNHLLLSSFEITPHFLKTLGIRSRLFKKPEQANDDSLKITWKTGQTWVYPGSAAAPELIPSATETETLASDARGFPSLLRIPYGDGTIWIQAQPMALSNYFLLHKNNHTYLESLMKELRVTGTSVIWDDYYPTLRSEADRQARNGSVPPEGKSFFLEMVRKHPPLQWAVFTFLAGALLFILNYARRLRQPIDRLPEMKNNSLEFTKAIAGLYRHRKDNAVIAQKIRAQLQDHLYNTHRIPARELTLENADTISRKTGKPLPEVIQLIETLNQVQEKVSDRALTEFYRLVYKFIYK